MTSNETEDVTRQELLVLSEADIAELWRQLGPELRAVASRVLGGGPSVEDSIGLANAAFNSLIGRFDAKDMVAEEDRLGLWPVLIKTVDPHLIAETQEQGQDESGLKQPWIQTVLRRLGFSIAENKAKEAVRKKLAIKRGRNWNRVDVDPSQQKKESDPVWLAEFEELLGLVKQYAEASKQSFMCEILRLKLQDLSSKEIAHELGVGEATVCRRLKEIRRFIEEQMED
ncbi:ECF-type sigma factor [Mariniblastus sp.]|nr:ECF-type sigma factor [Mariniblastus sp.]